STGRYDGDMLVVETTHLKQGWIRRNGVPMSDQATLTEYYMRFGDMFTRLMILIDPVSLTEPLVKSEEYFRSARELPAQTWLWVCDPVVEIATREAGEVPAYMPDEHPFKDEFARRHQLPEIAVRGGAATMYPEFQEVLKKNPPPPPLPPPSKAATRVSGPPQGQGQGRLHDKHSFEKRPAPHRRRRDCRRCSDCGRWPCSCASAGLRESPDGCGASPAERLHDRGRRR